jgi:hypothetical protein
MLRTGVKSVIAVLGIALVMSSTAFAAPTIKYKGLRTDVAIAAGFTAALTSLGVTVEPLRGSRIISGQGQFPVIAAEVDLASAAAEIIHSGGLKLSAGSTVVELSLFTIDTTSTPVLTGLVKANGSIVGRIPLFDIQLPALTLPLSSGRKLTIPNAVLTLSNEAAAALNSVFGVSAFVEGFEIGVAHVILKR